MARTWVAAALRTPLGGSGPTRFRSAVGCSLGAACLAVALAGSASATEFGSAGTGVGQITTPHGVAVEGTTGRVYVADQGNNRIDEFEPNGAFVRAWGWGVRTGAAELQTCTAATGCRQGLAAAGAGALSSPDGIAIDQATKDVWVVDSGNDRVQEFTPNGEFVLAIGGDVNEATAADVCTSAELGEGNKCKAGHSGTGAGEFMNLGEQGAVAVSEAGTIYVGDYRRVQWFNGSTGAVAGGFPAVNGNGEPPENQVEAVAVTSAGEICLTVNPSNNAGQEGPSNEVRCYSAAGTLLDTISLEEQPASQFSRAYIWLAADKSGHIFLDHYLQKNSAGVTSQAISEYGEGGGLLKVFPPPGGNSASIEKEAGGLALTESGGLPTGVVAGFAGEDVVRSGALPAPGPVVLEESAERGIAGCVKFSALLDAEGASTKYRFVYGSEPTPSSETVAATMATSGFKAETVTATQCGLSPETVYHYYVAAENAADVGKPAEGATKSVETGPAVKVDGLWAAQISESSVVLEADINPAGVATEYWFEYPQADGKYSKTAPTAIGAGTADVRVSLPVSGLAAHAVYDYSVRAKNAVGEVAADASFETQRAGAPPGMLDTRMFEQVSPPTKHGAAIRVSTGGGVIEATPDGSSITYYASTSPVGEPEGEPVPTLEQIISRRGADGWGSRDIAAPVSQRNVPRTGEGAEYWLFSSDLSREVVEPNAYTDLSRWTVGEERTPYVRAEAACPAEAASIAVLQQSECFTPLLVAQGPFADVEAGLEYGGTRSSNTGLLTPMAATPDLSKIVLKAVGAELVKGSKSHSIYEWSAGGLTPVSISPAGALCAGTLGVPGGVGNLGLNARNALSRDGAIAVWGSESASPECAGHLYLRDVPAGVTLQLDEVDGGSGEGAAEAAYEDASANGQLVFFTDSQRLTADARGTQHGLNGATQTTADLYAYSFDPSTKTGSLVDMTVPVNGGEAAGVQGVLGASEDGRVVYVVAHGVLTEAENGRGEAAQAGEDNLYALEDVVGAWKAGFIGTLSPEDAKDWAMEVATASSRVSPNGEWLAFMSERPLTGYDNVDRVSGARDEEVFLFDRHTGAVVCASCDPTGARPSGMFLRDSTTNVTPPLMDSAERAWNNRWVSGELPVRYSVAIGGMLGIHQPRYLSDGGRLFFDSTEALVPQDVNGKVDVYEYEPLANGEVAASDTCGESAATFAAAADGCIGLVSAGTSTQESVFLDASENGNDAFFLTAAKLTGSDADTAFDVYDAHSCGAGAAWGCAAPRPVSVAPCESTSACKAGAPAGQAGVGGLASEALEGAGNLAAVAGGKGAGVKAAKKKAGGPRECARGKRRTHHRCVKARKRRRVRGHKARRKTGRGVGDARRRPVSARGGR